MINDKMSEHEKELRRLLDISPWEGDSAGLYDELKEAAWNILHENPGTEFGDWQTMLVEQYPSEVVDALGTNPADVFAELTEWWDCMDFEDALTEECHTFREWAEYFATERSVELYDKLTEARREISRLDTQHHPRQ